MLNNHTYNLVQQLLEENKSLWHIQKNYRNDAEGCSECLAFWDELSKRKEDNVRKLSQLTKDHLLITT